MRSVDGEIVLGPVSEGPWAGLYRPLLGYWNRPAESSEVLVDAVLHTGDLGSLDERGHLRVVGRKNQVILRGGANVYPAEVERVLVEAPGVHACAVVGVPDARLGERVGAALEPGPGEEIDQAAVIEYCRSQLAGYKVPERMIVVDRLPRNQMGKVPRGDIVKMLEADPL
jgi:long-chain acyl-CoA synthetase